MGVEGVYICVRVFECVRDGEAERGSAGQKWREESAGIERMGGGEWSGLNHESNSERGCDGAASASSVSLFHATMIKYTSAIKEPSWLEWR